MRLNATAPTWPSLRESASARITAAFGLSTSLASAGQRDDEQLVIYGLAYSAELHDGPDPRFTDC